ncbi:MAG: DNA polymerase III subunit delta' [Syntrophales bacterium]|nr:DNA polymerase III subunit delta' [Syntrophales bacterium]
MSFQSIHGHNRQIRFILAALNQNRIPHAYLFSGMTGVGKRTVALSLAKMINCTGKKTSSDACNRCPSCLKMDHGNHPDILCVEPEGQYIRIKAIRDLQAQMQYNPLEGKSRVIVIDDADRMNITSANALLKTLEEPAPGNLLILITGNPHGLPRTILSRCQQIRFFPLGREIIAAYLEKHLALNKGDATMIAGAAGGSLAQAIGMAQGDYKAFRDQALDDLMAIHNNTLLKLLSFSSDFGKDREDIIQKLDVIRSCYRDAMIYRETGREDALINRDRMDIIGGMACRLDGRDLLERLHAVEHALQAIDQNANKALTLEAMMFKLAHQRRQEA